MTNNLEIDLETDMNPYQSPQTEFKDELAEAGWVGFDRFSYIVTCRTRKLIPDKERMRRARQFLLAGVISTLSVGLPTAYSAMYYAPQLDEFVRKIGGWF